jgi:hypothetical protein
MFIFAWLISLSLVVAGSPPATTVDSGRVAAATSTNATATAVAKDPFPIYKVRGGGNLKIKINFNNVGRPRSADVVGSLSKTDRWGRIDGVIRVPAKIRVTVLGRVAKTYKIPVISVSGIKIKPRYEKQPRTGGNDWGKPINFVDLTRATKLKTVNIPMVVLKHGGLFLMQEPRGMAVIGHYGGASPVTVPKEAFGEKVIRVSGISGAEYVDINQVEKAEDLVGNDSIYLPGQNMYYGGYILQVVYLQFPGIRILGQYGPVPDPNPSTLLGKPVVYNALLMEGGGG